MSDEETAGWLEKELSTIPDAVEAAQRAAIGHSSKLISVSIEYQEVKYAGMQNLMYIMEPPVLDSDDSVLCMTLGQLMDMIQGRYNGRTTLETGIKYRKNHV